MGNTQKLGTLVNGLTVDTNGNVCIGGSVDASYKLKVIGAIIVTGNAIFSSNITSNATSGAASFIASGSNTIGGANYIDFLKVTNTAIGASNINKTFRLNNAGAIEIVNSAYTSIIYTLTDTGIATFSNQVTMNGPNSDWATIIQNTNSSSGTSYGLKIKAGTNTGADATLVLQDYAGNEYLTARGNGKIGIGNTSPNYKLDISTSASGSVFAATSTYAWTGGYLDHSAFLAPNMTGGALSIGFGKENASYNLGKIIFNYIGNQSSSNSIGLGFYNYDNKLIIRGDGVILVGGSSARNALQPSNFGYSSSYRTLIIGSAGTNYTSDAVSLAFNVDVSGNSSGSFTGNGTEYIWRNTGVFITPNSANNAYNNLFGWNSSGQITFYNNFALNDQQLRTRYNSDANHALAHNQSIDGPFLYGYQGTALGYSSSGNYLKVIWTNTTNAYNYNNSTTWQQTSDIRVKQNLRPITGALDKICGLNPTHFEYKHKEGETKTGFIAQEFEQIFPGHVSETKPMAEFAQFFEEGEMIKTIDADLIPYLVKSIQELKQEIEILKNK